MAMAQAKRLFLIDGMSHIYRAYHAIRSLSTSYGLATNAVYGFAAMLRKLIAEDNPDYIAVAMDEPGPTARHKLFEEYKATRRPMPDDLAAQLPYILRLCRAFRIPVISHPEYEADDVIGTLARKAAAAGLFVFIVTQDKDMYQLVSERVLVLDTRKNHDVVDAAKVEEKLGVTPQQVPELLGLQGDPVDNIPGAPGIGDKGAQALLRRFGTIEECLRNWEQVENKKYRESLRRHAEQIRRSRELATIRTDLPIPLDLDELAYRGPDRQAAAELFKELEFVSLLKGFAGRERPEGDYGEAQGEGDLRQLLEACRKSRRAGLSLFRIPEGEIGLAISPEAGRARAFRLNAAAIPAAAEMMADADIKKVCHDLKKLRLDLEALGIDRFEAVEDIMLAAYLLDPNKGSYRLERIAIEQLGHQMKGLAFAGDEKRSARDEIDRELLALGACEAADLAGRLEPLLAAKLQEAGLDRLYRELELPLVEVLAEMERTGVKIDAPRLESLSRELEASIAELTGKIYKVAGQEFNINSPRQLGEILFEKMNLPVIGRTEKTRSYSTNVKVLTELADMGHELPALILQYRELSKLKSTYVDALPALVDERTGRVHTSYNQTGTATGRLSSSEPNFQNLPVRTELGRNIRAAVVAEEGHLLVSADYSQIELRIMAHLSEDPVLIDAFNKGEDIHERTALEVFGEAARRNPAEFRRRAKTINFGVIYGLSAFSLARDLKISAAEAQQFIDGYFARYRGVKSWLERTLRQAHNTGQVHTLFGRIRQIPEIRSPDRNLRSFGERAAINSPIQGTAADLMKMAMIRVHGAIKQLGLGARMILQVHDELVFEAPEREAEAVRRLAIAELQSVYKLKVPLVVESKIGRNWRNME